MRPSQGRFFKPRKARARRRLPCCSYHSKSDTQRTTPGSHTHGRRPRAHDHATGTGFVKDRSTTKAVLARMEALGAW